MYKSKIKKAVINYDLVYTYIDKNKRFFMT